MPTYEEFEMTRPDGRAADEIRPFSIEPGFTQNPEASVLTRCGNTIVWCAASVEDRQPRWMDRDSDKGWITAEYMMLPASTTPRSRREGRRGNVGGRTMEIQRLIGRSLRAVADLDALGPRTISLDCEVLQADGGTRTTSITGAFVALMLACGKLVEDGLIKKIPLRHTVAAVSVGMVGGKALLDLPYVEDVAADVDMNVVMTGNGRFIEVQGTGEEATFSDEEFASLIKLARKGVMDLTDLQRAVLPDTPVYQDLFE